MTIGVTLPFEQEQLMKLSTSLNEVAWFQQFRQDALAKAEQLELPKPDKTNIKNWDFFGENPSIVVSEATKLENLPAYVTSLASDNFLIQHNTGAAHVVLSETLRAKGVVFTDMMTAVREHSELVEKYIMQDGVKVDENRLTALHAACINNGAFLYVPKNVIIEEPIQAVFYYDGAVKNIFNHVLVVADTNSAVTYVENVIAEDVTIKVNMIGEVLVGENAQVHFGAVDTLSKDTVTYVNRRGVVSRNGKLEWALGLMNDGDTVSENVTNLIGDGSVANTKMVTIGRGKQKQNFTTKIVHFGKHSEGDILKHGVVRDEASHIFNGIGKIEHGASKSNAQQASRVLMLNEKARGDANPILLIDEDDVLAGHAASAGRVDPNTLYYLMSRGIPKKEAERLVIHGFLAPVVNELPIEAVKQRLVEVIEGKVK
ncbi:MAG: Fe-S cluster assembly protein SufD [Bacillaceae bacterium]